MFKPEYRKAERDAYCRACELSLKKGDDMVSWYSCRNRGMHIHLHPDCVKEMYNVVIDKEPHDIIDHTMFDNED